MKPFLTCSSLPHRLHRSPIVPLRRLFHRRRIWVVYAPLKPCLNFPVMDMNRNAIWRNPERVPQGGIERMTKFWGDESWKQAAYAESPQGSLFGPVVVKQGNDAIVASFRQRLKKVAGFQFVPEPLPMRNSTNAVVYYLFFASQKPVAERIISDIFSRYNTGLTKC